MPTSKPATDAVPRRSAGLWASGGEVGVEPPDEVGRDLVAVGLVEDLVPRAGVQGAGDVRDSDRAVLLRHLADPLAVASHRSLVTSDEQDRQVTPDASHLAAVVDGGLGAHEVDEEPGRERLSAHGV